jgi:hypothetical protein
MSSPLAGRGDDDLLRARRQVLGGVVAAREEARGLDDDVHAEVAPRQLAGVALLEDLQRLAVDGQAVAGHLDRAGVGPEDRVVLEQVRERVVVGEVVDRHPLDVRARGLRGAEDVAADAAEAVDANPDGHAGSP